LPTYFWWLKVTFEPMEGHNCKVFEIYDAVAVDVTGDNGLATHCILATYWIHTQNRLKLYAIFTIRGVEIEPHIVLL